MFLIKGLSNAAAGNITSCNKHIIKQRELSFPEKASKLVSKQLGENVTWEVLVEKKRVVQKHTALES